MEVLIRGREKCGKSVDTAETNETDRKYLIVIGFIIFTLRRIF